jgi:hypothetical protein
MLTVYVLILIIVCISAVIGSLVIFTKYLAKLKRELSYLDQMVIGSRESLIQNIKEINNLNRYICSLQLRQSPKQEDHFDQIKEAETEDTIYNYDLNEIDLKEVGRFESKSRENIQSETEKTSEYMERIYSRGKRN